jgi:hypothetical protein
MESSKSFQEPRTPGKPNAGGQWGARISRRISAMEGVISSAEERPKRAVGGSVVGTKKEGKRNFRVRFLHTTSRN